MRYVYTISLVYITDFSDYFFSHKINGVKSLFDDTWLDKFQIENIQTQWYHQLTPSTDVHFVKNLKKYIYTNSHLTIYTIRDDYLNNISAIVHVENYALKYCKHTANSPSKTKWGTALIPHSSSMFN